MRSVWSLAVMIFALAALLSPSLSVGLRLAAPDAPVVATSTAPADLRVELQRPCPQQGGTRVLPCQPDLGFLAAPPRAAGGDGRPAYELADELLRPSAESAAPLPPPRA
jgi:hypothetical protein